MSYCVNCGVELERSQKSCPLCSTPVINPNDNIEVNVIPPYPIDSVKSIVRKLRKAAGLLITIILVIPLIVCPLCDFLITGTITWSVYVISAVVYAWTMIVPPVLITRTSFNFFIWLDFAATNIFLKVLNQTASPTTDWFHHISFPITVFLMISFYIGVFVYRHTHHLFKVIAAEIFLSGLMCIITEYLIHRFLHITDDFVWSIPVAVSCIGVSVMLMVVYRMTKLRSNLKKRMHI